MYEDYDNADWWKREDEDQEVIKAVTELTEAEKKIAHYEERARNHWEWWKETGSKVYLYHYKQANIKARKLKQEQALKNAA